MTYTTYMACTVARSWFCSTAYMPARSCFYAMPCTAALLWFFSTVCTAAHSWSFSVAYTVAHSWFYTAARGSTHLCLALSLVIVGSSTEGFLSGVLWFAVSNHPARIGLTIQNLHFLALQVDPAHIFSFRSTSNGSGGSRPLHSPRLPGCHLRFCLMACTCSHGDLN